jgi:thiosulfate/3-mercaptopyruvate sulfurtransferase
VTNTNLIHADELLPHLSDPNWAIVDCRFQLEDTDAARWDYLVAHIPGAVYAHLDWDLSGFKTGRNGRHPLPAVEAFCSTLGSWGITPETQVVAYDATGGGIAAARLWWMLRYLGHTRVALLDGGWNAWLTQGHRSRAGNERRQSTEYRGRPDPGMTCDIDFVAHAAQSPDWAVIDARGPTRYRGEEEPIDPVAGHVPGALNGFWKDSLAPDGTLLPREELRARFTSLIAGVPPDHVITYCGSGVSAAFVIFAMELAGLPGAKLFPGSWSEWSNDRSRAVATGSTP